MVNESTQSNTAHKSLTPPIINQSKTRRPRAIYDGGTIQVVPKHLLHGPARWALVALAHRGHICVLHPLGKEPDEFKIWIEALAQIRAGHNGYVRLDEWCEHWRTHYRQLYLSGTSN